LARAVLALLDIAAPHGHGWRLAGYGLGTAEGAIPGSGPIAGQSCVKAIQAPKREINGNISKSLHFIIIECGRLGPVFAGQLSNIMPDACPLGASVQCYYKDA
jgi:hypothetical protein